jgi:transglutaminase-like putative cysteine protease
MSMQHRIVHTTRFDYDGNAVASYNQARLTPVTTPEQIVVHSRLEVAPKPWTYDYRDYFGTQVIAYEVVDPHEAMTVTATSTVQVNRPVAHERQATWEQLAAREVSDRWTEYLMVPALVAPPHDFVQRARTIASASARPGEAARELCALVADEVEYVPGTTDVHTTAGRSWQQRAGVCQDMAHLVLGGLRSIGIPARYVSGYHHPSADPAVGETVAGASHAWVEWWDDGWQPFDLTAAAVPDDRYVVLAAGRDYDDVKPISGIYSGAATTDMTVAVEVTRLA